MDEHALIAALERGTDARVTERLKSAADREERLLDRLKRAGGLLGSLCEAYYEQDGAYANRSTALGRVLDSNSELRDWWADSKEWYRTYLAATVAAAQRERERADAERKRTVRRALKKLTPEERKAMGYTSGKRV